MGCIRAGGLDDPVGVLMKGSKPVFQPGSKVPQLLVCAGCIKANGRNSETMDFLLLLALCPQHAMPSTKPCSEQTSLSNHDTTPYPHLENGPQIQQSQVRNRPESLDSPAKQHCSELNLDCLRAVKANGLIVVHQPPKTLTDPSC